MGKMQAAFLAAAVLVASGVARATPAHYVVFEVDSANAVTPVFYRRVDIAPATTQRIRDDARRRDDGLDYRVLRNGAAVATRHVDIRGLRAEFANDPEHGDNRIVARPVREDKRYFTLRMPIADGDAVEFGEGASTQHLSLAGIAAKASTLTYANAAPLHIQSQVNAGNPANRVDILVLGDGYTASQQGLFDADAQILHDSFFGLRPYKDYRNFVNWTTGFIASNQSGATHPPYQAGCTQNTCCSDTAAQSDPLAGQVVDNRFGARFCTYQVHRLVTINYPALMAAASAYPDWDEVMVVVNDPVYGGAGGPYSLTTTEQSADQIVLHEYGHSFSKLADEYYYAGSGTPSCDDASNTSACPANVTNLSNAAVIKWRSWFTPNIAIPTPGGTAGVGLFEGADYLSTGMYRPKDYQCLMNYLGQPFCPVCTQEYVLSMYRGGWGRRATASTSSNPVANHRRQASRQSTTPAVRCCRST
jgi:hypothetical protein